MGVTDRFKDALWMTTDRVIVGGAGGIGSWITLFLARIGYRIVLYDNDTFEEHNMGGQFVIRSGIGQPKVKAVRQLVSEFGGTSISTVNELYTLSSSSGKFMIAAFDNMDARRVMFENWFKYNSTKKNADALFIDGRLSFEQLQIICVTPSTTKRYREKHLFSDSDVEDANCSLKQTSHSAAMIAGLMTGFFTNHIANIQSKNNGRTIPFEYEYIIPLNLQSDVISY